MDQHTAFQRMGGHRTFAALTREFYRGVAGDAQLRAMYPEADLGPAEDRLRLFLEQYWGGPGTYHDLRGHPRLRLRHAPFPVTPEMRDRWLGHMMAALDHVQSTAPMGAEEEAALRDYLTRTAHFLVNAAEPPPPAVPDPGSGEATRPTC